MRKQGNKIGKKTRKTKKGGKAYVYTWSSCNRRNLSQRRSRYTDLLAYKLPDSYRRTDGQLPEDNRTAAGGQSDSCRGTVGQLPGDSRTKENAGIWTEIKKAPCESGFRMRIISRMEPSLLFLEIQHHGSSVLPHLCTGENLSYRVQVLLWPDQRRRKTRQPQLPDLPVT